MQEIQNMLLNIKEELQKELILYESESEDNSNIQDIEKKSEAIFEKLSGLKKEETLQYKKEIEEIICYLTRMSEAVQKKYNNLHKEIEGIQNRNQAIKAYNQSINLRNNIS